MRDPPRGSAAWRQRMEADEGAKGKGVKGIAAAKGGAPIADENVTVNGSGVQGKGLRKPSARNRLALSAQGVR